MSFVRLLFCLLPVLFAHSVAAGELEDALYAYDHGAGPRAVELLTPLAEAGEVKAQEALLHIYAYGEGVPVDLDLTYKWSLRAAELGSPIGENSVGASYSRGEAGLTKDVAEARRWFRRAVGKGNVKAKYALGQNYLLGLTEKADPIMAIAYVEAAADAGYEKAQLLAGSLLASGRYGVLRDDAMAVHYYELAAENGNLGAYVFLGVQALFTPTPFSQRAEGVKWILLAERGGCNVARPWIDIVIMQAPPTFAKGVRLANEWATSHGPRDPHVHAEDLTDGCPPVPSLLRTPSQGA